jgi:hypothetical protein
METLTAIANRLYGTDPYKKPPIYTDEYHTLLSPLRMEPIRFLEIGVHKGISMQMWKEYLPQAVIVGIDWSPKPESFPSDDRFHFLQGDQGDPALLDKAYETAGGQFDAILDDASHLGCHTARSFAHLFPKALKPGGIYIIEDTCTAFGPDNFDGAVYSPPELGLLGMPRIFPSHQYGMIGFIKQLVDHSQAPTAVGGYTRYAIKRITVMTNFAVLHKAS